MNFISHNQFHLGDNLVHLHFLRGLAKKYPDDQFIHFAHPCHLPQLESAVTDLDNLLLQSLAQPVNHGYNAWKNAGAGQPGGGFWETHPFKNQFAEFHLKWFAHLAKNMGLESPFTKTTDLLFDYPALRDPVERIEPETFDFLIVNSQPCSGQFRAYDSLDCMDELVRDLARAHSVITTKPVGVLPCTLDWNLTLTEIGALSLRIPHLVMVATGPMWPTFNIWNQGSVKTRLLLLDCGEDLTSLCPGTVQTSTLAGAREILETKGLL